MTPTLQFEVLTAVRITGRTSLVLFLGAFVGTALRSLWRTSLSEWVERQRGRLLIALAGSHTVHLGTIIALGAVSHGRALEQPIGPVIVFGGVAYLLIYTMAAAGLKRAARWTWPSRIRLNAVGMYYVWLIFLVTYAPRTAHSLFYLPFTLVLLSALLLRLSVGLRPNSEFTPASLTAVSEARPLSKTTKRGTNPARRAFDTSALRFFSRGER